MKTLLKFSTFPAHNYNFAANFLTDTLPVAGTNMLTVQLMSDSRSDYLT